MSMTHLPPTEFQRAWLHLSAQREGRIPWKVFAGETMWGPDDGFVYFITLGAPSAWVKVGYTSSDPYARMKALQTGCPVRMAMRGFVIANMGLEQDLHAVFEHERREGEWFEHTEWVERIISSHLSTRTAR